MKKFYEAPECELLCSEDVMSDTTLFASENDNIGGEGDWGDYDQEDEFSF